MEKRRSEPEADAGGEPESRAKAGGAARVWWAAVVLLVIAAVGGVGWWRIAGPSQTAEAFVEALNAGDFERAGAFLSPSDQPLPGPWAHPRKWGDEGAVEVEASVQPLSVSQILAGERYVQVIVTVDAEAPSTILPHRFRVTRGSFERERRRSDVSMYPVQLRGADDAEAEQAEE